VSFSNHAWKLLSEVRFTLKEWLSFPCDEYIVLLPTRNTVQIMFSSPGECIFWIRSRTEVYRPRLEWLNGVYFRHFLAESHELVVIPPLHCTTVGASLSGCGIVPEYCFLSIAESLHDYYSFGVMIKLKLRFFHDSFNLAVCECVLPIWYCRFLLWRGPPVK
jgi:hypothetical protein